MRKIGRSKVQEQTGRQQQYLPLREFAREALWEHGCVIGLGLRGGGTGS